MKLNQQRIRDAIQASPGITYSGLYQVLKLSRRTTAKHIKWLENKGLARRESGRGSQRDRFFLSGDECHPQIVTFVT